MEKTHYTISIVTAEKGRFIIFVDFKSHEEFILNCGEGMFEVYGEYWDEEDNCEKDLLGIPYTLENLDILCGDGTVEIVK